MKTYIGKISHGFNFLGYYFDNNKLLPSQESIRRLKERAFALYERPLNSRKYHRHKNAERDISDYQANEASPSDEEFKTLLTTLLAKASQNPDKDKRLRRYLGQWCRWLKCGLYAIDAFLISMKMHLPSLYVLYPCSSGTRSSGLIA